MAKYVLRCFLFPSCHSHISSVQISSKDLDAYYNSYSEGLDQLSKTFSHGSVSLKWSVEAMKILKKMQLELLILLKKSDLPISSGAEDGNWFNQYMKDSITTLDLCHSLKLAISRVDQYHMMVDIMISKLHRNDSSETMKFESKKYSYFNTVKETVRQYEAIRSEEKSNNSVMVAISVLLHSTIVSPASTELCGYDIACKFPQLKPFIEMLSMPIGEFNERDSAAKNSSESEFVEHEIVVRVMVDIQTQVMDGIEDEERFLSSLELLRTSSIELKEEIEKFDAAVIDVFDVVIRGRNEMLGVFRDRDLSIG